MVHKLALLLGGVASAGILALAVAAAGLGPAAPAAVQADAGMGFDAGSPTGDTQPAADVPADTVKTVVDTVYIAPTPEPPVLREPNTGSSLREPAVTTKHARPTSDVERGDRERDEDGSEDREDDGEHEQGNGGEHEPGDD